MKFLTELSFVIVLACISMAQETPFNLSTKTLDLAVGQSSRSIAATADEGTFPASAAITWKGGESYVEISQELSADKKIITSTFTPKKAGSVRLTASFGEFSQQVQLRISPEITPETLQFSPSIADQLSIAEKGRKEFSLTLSTAERIPTWAISVSSDASTIASAALVNNQLTITALRSGKTDIRVRANGAEVKVIPVEVTGGFDADSYRNKTYTVKKGQVRLFADFLGSGADKLEPHPPDDSQVATLSNDKKGVKGESVNSTTMKLALKDNPDENFPITIKVVPTGQKIVVNNLPTRSMVLNQRLTISSAVSGDGETIDDAEIKITSSDESCILVGAVGNNSHVITALKENCTVTLTASATGEYSALPQEKYVISVRGVAGFKLLRIRLDLMDNQTAKDLFGRKAVDEYFIAKVRLFNRIGREDNNAGQSILVYSESLEVNVGVEYRKEGQAWTTLTENYAKTLLPIPLTLPQDDKSKKICETLKTPNMFIPYRPLTFEMVLNTQDRRDSRSARSRLLRIMHGASSLASFVTSIAVPGSSSDLPLGLEKFRNLFIPSYEKLFPSLNELQRQNITSMVMQPLEEIPFGSDITRVVFFPKRKIFGMILPEDGKKIEVRIAAVSIADACAETGIIEKIPTTEPVNP